MHSIAAYNLIIDWPVITTLPGSLADKLLNKHGAANDVITRR